MLRPCSRRVVDDRLGDQRLRRAAAAAASAGEAKPKASQRTASVGEAERRSGRSRAAIAGVLRPGWIGARRGAPEGAVDTLGSVDERALAERLITYDTSNIDGLRAAAGFVKGWLEAREIDVVDHDFNGLPVLTAEIGPRRRARDRPPRPPRRRPRPRRAVPAADRGRPPDRPRRL